MGKELQRWTMIKKGYEHYASFMSSKMKWTILIVSIIFLLGLIGYSIILFGGKLVIDDEKLILDRKSTRLNSSHVSISYAVFCLKKKKNNIEMNTQIHISST